MQTSVFLIGETIENLYQKSCEDLIMAGRGIISIKPGDIVMAIAGQDIKVLTEKISQRESINTIAIMHDSFRYPNPILLSKALIPLLEQYKPAFVCLSHTMRGCQIAGFLSHQLSAPCVTAVESFIKHDNGSLIFRKSMFNGKLTAKICPGNANPVILTVSSGITCETRTENHFNNSAKVSLCKIDKNELLYVPLNIIKCQDNDHLLENAEVIVSAGNGIGKEEFINLIYETAAIFNHAAVGASRIVCDRGWMPYSRQIGETGKKVTPRIYLACGISGSMQHMAGIKNAQMIIAVNTDSQAPILNAANYAVIEDLKTFLPILIKKYHDSFSKAKSAEGKGDNVLCKTP